MYEFSADFFNSLKTEIKKALDQGAEPIAAFDADGTLWATDMGESFFDHIIDNKLVDLPQDPWGHYENIKKTDPPAAYTWLAQICDGVPVETVKSWSEDCLKQHKSIGWIGGQKQLIEFLHESNVNVYVVTASIKWAVEPGALAYSIKPENVIGVKTHIESGKVTDKPFPPVTWRQGKVDGLLEVTNGKKPFLCSGNSSGDLELLDAATHIRLALNTAPEGNEMFETEHNLQNLAKDKNWFHYSWN